MSDAFHQLVRHLVADGDRRAALAGSRARRPLGEMRQTLQPLLTFGLVAARGE
ncbi:hypothetical protein ABZ348_30515 [Streptomyces sp. NPDC005963]|uniref:hypothetical protein n=1 Tax=Streptomyces sp. NPDC005963 TaxID=3156721 RepID=UPI0033E6BC91